MKIALLGVMVDDQDKALRFYTEILGSVKKKDIPLGEFRRLTVVSPDGPDGVEALLEPTGSPASRTYQRALFEAGIPLATFAVGDIQKEHQRLKALSVAFSMAPTKMGPVAAAVFQDTCGNLIQTYRA